MKRTHFEVSFYFEGVTHEDNRQLRFLMAEERALCDDLEAAAAIPPLEHEGNFPSTPEEMVEYEREITDLVAPETLLTVAQMIEAELNRGWRGAKDNCVRRLRPESELFKRLRAKADPKYVLRSRAASVWIPCGTGCHRIETIVAFSEVPTRDVVWFINANHQVYRYNIMCQVKLVLGV